MSSRLEPLLDISFASIKPAPVPRHQYFPFSDDIQYNFSVLYDDTNDTFSQHDFDLSVEEGSGHPELSRKVSSMSTMSTARQAVYRDATTSK